MKKFFTIIIISMLILIVLCSYIALYCFTPVNPYAEICSAMREIFTLVLISSTVAWIIGLCFGALIGLCGKWISPILCITDIIGLPPAFLISALIIALFGNNILVIMAALALPTFPRALKKSAGCVADIRKNNYATHRFCLKRFRYFKSYTLPFFVLPCLSVFLKIIRTTFYSVFMFYIFQVLKLPLSDPSSGVTLIISVMIVILLINILNSLTSNKEGEVLWIKR